MSDEDNLPVLRRHQPPAPPDAAKPPVAMPASQPGGPVDPPSRWAGLFSGLRGSGANPPPPVSPTAMPVGDAARTPPPPSPAVASGGLGAASPAVPPAPPPPPAALGAGGGQGAGSAVARVASGTAHLAMDAVRYGVLVAQLTAAGRALRGVGERVRGTYAYVEECARSVDHLADLAAGLDVDGETVGEHRQAAVVGRDVVSTSRRLAARTEELSRMFEQARADHEADYGPVVQQAQAMHVPMANRQFYRNR